VNDQIERDLRKVLGDIVAQAPQHLRQPDHLGHVSAPVKHRSPLLVVALGVSLVAVIAGLVALRYRTTAPAQVPTTEVATTVPPLPSPVVGTPTCGTDLPVNISVPNSIAGPINGAAPLAIQRAADGQYSRYWNVSGGAVEVRWPADSQPLYNSDQLAPDPFTSGGSAVAQDGSEIDIKEPAIDPASEDVDTYTVVMTTKADVTLVEPCDRLQIRTIRSDGSQNAVALDAKDLSRPTVDLNPLIRSTQDVAAAPVADDSQPCSAPSAASTGLTAAATPGEALASYLSQATTGVSERSGYDEYHVVAEDSYVYQHKSEGTVGATITVRRTDSIWRVAACTFHLSTAAEQQAQIHHLFDQSTAATTTP
jgi:hypothetical protein